METIDEAFSNQSRGRELQYRALTPTWELYREGYRFVEVSIWVKSPRRHKEIIGYALVYALEKTLIIAKKWQRCPSLTDLFEAQKELAAAPAGGGR